MSPPYLYIIVNVAFCGTIAKYTFVIGRAEVLSKPSFKTRKYELPFICPIQINAYTVPVVDGKLLFQLRIPMANVVFGITLCNQDPSSSPRPIGVELVYVIVSLFQSLPMPSFKIAKPTAS